MLPQLNKPKHASVVTVSPILHRVPKPLSTTSKPARRFSKIILYLDLFFCGASLFLCLDSWVTITKIVGELIYDQGSVIRGFYRYFDATSPFYAARRLGALIDSWFTICGSSLKGTTKNEIQYGKNRIEPKIVIRDWQKDSRWIALQEQKRRVFAAGRIASITICIRSFRRKGFLLPPTENKRYGYQYRFWLGRHISGWLKQV